MEKIKNPHYLIVGEKYRIFHPVYDDYNEGILPDIDIVEVFNKVNDGYLLKNIEHNFTYKMSFSILMNCEIEQIK